MEVPLAKIKIGEETFLEEQLTEEGRQHLQSLRFIEVKFLEIDNLTAALNMAKNSYIQQLKNNIIASKAGLS
jgi:hypothetical protein|tara:strand:+ start:4517 stop:4732 length:216 start_codon:yes stop_codon:yes gene_type:complete